MRALTAVITLALWPGCLHADSTQQTATDLDLNHHAILTKLNIKDKPIKHLVDCARALGPTKCFTALSAFRAEKANLLLQSGREAQFSLAEDVEQFPWKKYTNISSEKLYSDLCDETDQLLQYRTLSFSISPEYLFKMQSRGNGTLNIDVMSNEIESGRSSMKKMQKKFYQIMPLLLIPGLVMSAILPFVLPALKLMVVGVGMLNNMALSGAVFTLLRNNAFNDNYEKRIVYVNAGYKNEKHIDYHDDEHYGSNGAESNNAYEVIAGEDFDHFEEFPLKSGWINEYSSIGNQGHTVYTSNRRKGERRKRNKHKRKRRA